MRALSIRQPFAELILRGMKTVEYRSRRTNIIGERFYIYASRQRAVGSRQGEGIWSQDLAVATEPLEPWMIELAEGLRLWEPGELPTGVIVGSAVIRRCEEVGGGESEVGKETRASSRPPTHNPRPTVYHWHLSDVQRIATPRKPKGHPQPVWFEPF